MLIYVKKIGIAFSSFWLAFLLFLPDEFSKYRVRYYNYKGAKIDKRTSISPNVRIRGKFEMQEGSSIAQNASISGGKAGVFIGKNVMIAPNVVIVAFNHGFEDICIPMVDQPVTEDAILIKDDVWIASNCTIGKGVTIGEGSIIGANSFVNKDVPPYSIVGGVPARVVKSRKTLIEL